MHPILGPRGRLLIYLGVWLPLGGVLAAILASVGGLHAVEALLFAVPLALFYAFICLAAWYPARSTPLTRLRLWPAIGTHAAAALVSSGLWLLVGFVWARLLGRLEFAADVAEGYVRQLPLLLAAGILLYLLAAASAYLYLAFDASRQAEKRALLAQKNQEVAARELELARALQQRLQPPTVASGTRYRLAARNLAARFMAGDFYDYFELGDRTLRIAVADVAGKGIAASLVMASVKAVLPLMAADRSVVETLRQLNEKLVGELGDREFVALALAGFDPRTGRLELSNAGLPDPYLLRGNGPAEPLEAPAPRLPLGLKDTVEYGSLVVDLHPGDRVLFLTDGLPEAPAEPGEPLGYEAFQELLDHRRESPELWLDELVERVRAATLDEQEDDWTVLLLEATMG